MSWEIYLGPYFECVRKPVEVTVTRRVCSSPKCANHTPDYAMYVAFCSRCGSAVIAKDEPGTRFNPLSERVSEQLREMYVVHAVAFMVPNVRRDGDCRRSWDADDEERVSLDIGALDVPAERNWLDSAFAAERAILVAECVSVETKWGFHRWWS